MSENEKGPSLEKLRSYKRFEEQVMADDSKALRAGDGGIRRRDELTSFFKDFFRGYLRMSKEEANTAVRKFDDLFEQRIDLMKQKKEGKTTQEVTEKHAEIDEAFIQRMQKVIAEYREQKNITEQKNEEPPEPSKKENTLSDTDEESARRLAEQDDEKEGDGRNTSNAEGKFTVEVPEDPRELSKEAFRALPTGEGGVEHLNQLLENRTREFDLLCKRKGIKKDELARMLQEQGHAAPVGWKTHQENKKSILEYLKRADAEGVVVDATVANSFHDLWVAWFENSDKIWQLVEEPGSGEKNDTNNTEKLENSDEKPEDEGIEKPDAGVDAPQASTPPDTEAEGDNTKKENEYAWREGVEEFSGDLEYRKDTEDRIDSLDQELVDTVAHPEALYSRDKGGVIDEYEEIQRLGREIKEVLAQKEQEEQGFGMYGHLTGIEYSDEEKQSIQEKLDRIVELKENIYEDLGTRHQNEHTELKNSTEGGDLGDEAHKEDVEAKREMKLAQERYLEALKRYNETEKGKSKVTRGFKSTLSFFGVGTDAPADVQEYERRYVAARRRQVEIFAEKVAKRSGRKDEKGLDTKYRLEDENFKAAVAEKYVMRPAHMRKEVHEEVFPSSDSEARVFAMLRTARVAAEKHKWTYRVGVIAAAGFTGGTAYAIGASFRKAVGMAVGVGGAIHTTKKVHSILGKRIEKQAESVTGTEDKFRKDFNIDMVDGKTETAYRKQQEKLSRMKKRQGTVSAGAGVAVGWAAGSATSDLVGALQGAQVPDGVQTSEQSMQESDKNDFDALPQEDVPTAFEDFSDRSDESGSKPMVDDHRSEGTNSWGGVIDENKLAETQEGETGQEPRVESHHPEGTTGGTPSSESYTGPGVDDELIAESQKGFEDGVEELDAYDLQKGDNLWNILEGKGPDANPVGGQSEVLKGMSLEQRNMVLDTFVDRLEHDPELTKSLGIGSGDPHKIYPSEHINIATSDKILAEIAQEKGYVSDVSENMNGTTMISEHVNKQVTDTGGYERPGPDDGLRGDDTPEPQADTPQRDGGDIRNDPYPMDEGPPPDINQQKSEFILTENERTDFLKEHFKGSDAGGFFGLLSNPTPDVYDTFTHLQEKTMEEIAQMVPQEAGISEEKWNAFVDTLEADAAVVVPDSPDETLGEYMDRYLAAQEAPTNVQNIA